MNNKIILDLCGGTGAWSRPYKKAGYDVRIITLPEYDVKSYQPPEGVCGILAAPPCTHFSRAGNRYWKAKGRSRLLEALEIVMACLDIIYWCKPHFWCLENPVGRLQFFIGKYVMTCDPCDYGDRYTKKTCLWGDFQPMMKGELIFTETERQHNIQNNRVLEKLPDNYELPPDMNKRQAARAITPGGFAQAFFEANR